MRWINVIFDIHPEVFCFISNGLNFGIRQLQFLNSISKISALVTLARAVF